MDTKALRQKVLDLAIKGKLVEKEGEWEEMLLSEICEFMRNGANIRQTKGASGLPITRIETISNGVVDRERMGYADIVDDSYEKYYLQEGDILMSHINSPIHVGKTALYHYEKGEKIIHGMNLLCLRMKDIVLPEYMNYYFYSNNFRENIRQYIKNAVNQASINTRNLGSVKVPLPPLSEQKRIVAEVEKWMSIIDVLENSKDDLKQAIDQAKAKILDLAIKGKLVEKEGEWEEKQFKDIFIAFHSNKNKIPQREIEESGKYPVVTQSANYVEGYSNREDCIIIVEKPILLFGDHTRIVKYLDFDFVVGADGVKLFATNEFEKYAYYLLLWASHQIENRGYSRHFQYLQKIQFSVPVLSEQHRIVEKVEQLFAQLDKIANSIK